MIRPLRTVATFCFSAAMLAAAAGAALPKVLDHVPSGSAVVIAVHSLDRLDAEGAKFTGALKLPEAATLRQGLAAMGITQGVNFDGSAALVLLSADFDNGDEPPMVALIPTTDFNALARAMGAEGGAAGVVQAQMHGDDVFLKKIDGGFAVVGPVREHVESFTGKAGQLNTFNQLAGKVGSSVADASDVFAIASIQALSPLIDQWLEGMREGMQQAAAMGGEQAAQMQAPVAMVENMVATLKRDGRSMVAGLDFGVQGASFDLGLVFAEASPTAKLMQGAGKATSLLGKLPAKPFMFAYSADYTHAATRSILAAMAAMQGDAAGGMWPMGGAKPEEMLKIVDGQAGAVYPNPAGFMAGLFANTIQFNASSQPQELIAQTRKFFEQMGKVEGMPVQITATYTPNETQVNGKPADGWSMQIVPTAGGMGGAQIMQFMGMLFGQGGLGGYLMATDDGVYQTLSKNSQLLADATRVGAGSSLAADASIKQVAEKLPNGRIAEVYVGVRSILEQTLPLAQMFLGVQIAIPADLPPVGSGVAASDGAIRATTFMPVQVIQFAVTAGEQMQQMMGGGMGPGGGRPAGNDRPKF